MKTATILVVDDERLIRFALKERLEKAGHRVVEAENGREARGRFEEGVDLTLLDVGLPDTDGISLLKHFRETDKDALVIMLTANAAIDTAVEAMKLGAHHYLNKPFNFDELLLLVDKALETSQLRREVKAIRASQGAYGIASIIGESAAMKATKALLVKIAGSPASTVLLTGESGTGKDLAAKVIHHASSRASGPFMNITCSALPEALLESELFGHEKGAFTGADRQKKGLLESADCGTVFLDEIGEMPLVLQAKLLRFLEERAFRRVGGAVDIKPDIRVIAATNRNLEQQVADGKFREDLFYRLNVLPVKLPPLRERGEDLELLFSYYIDGFNREFKKSVKGVSPEALKLLSSYPWPGNIRELRNAAERAMLLADGDWLQPGDFLMLAASGAPVSVAGGFKLPPGGINVEELERDLVAQALERTGGNQTQAAALLGTNRDYIRYRIEKFGLAVAHSSKPSRAK